MSVSSPKRWGSSSPETISIFPWILTIPAAGGIAYALLGRLPEALGGRLRERFDCHELAQLDTAGLEALAPRVRGMVASGESVVGRELIARFDATLEVASVRPL